MRKIIKSSISLFIFIFIFSVNVFAGDLSYIEEALVNLGVNEDYSENIVEYLENIEISESDFQEIENNVNDIKEVVQNNDEDINFLKYYTVYDNIMDIAKIMNLDLDVDLSDLSISLIDKNNNNILYEGDTNSLMQIYSNYRESNYAINVAEIFEDINNLDENEIVISDTENNTNINEDIFNNEIDSNLDTKSDLNISNNEKNNVLDEYIDKFEKYDKELLVNNNDDIIEWEIVLIVFGVALAVFIMFKIISRVKRLQ
ncbi:hypothetical protein H8S10_06135 [Clostridium sp. NSJ-49]|uniref:hypothetical protein n=1 Tax=Clostridium TaxID=1485 RepID=UPI00164BDB6F|nr:hypothetical protein [Clostridium sp. NSJ-49]MBC5625035.1 hypothetical protein [Clostridium sp. NSJ-49]